MDMVSSWRDATVVVSERAWARHDARKRVFESAARFGYGSGRDTENGWALVCAMDPMRVSRANARQLGNRSAKADFASR